MAAAYRVALWLTPAAAARAAACRRLPLLLASRAASTKPGRAVVSQASGSTAFTFDHAPIDAPLFPELFEPGKRAVLLAVDPDIAGAVAALSWHNPPAPSGSPHAVAEHAAEAGAGSSSSANLSMENGSSSSSSSSSGSSGGGPGSSSGSGGSQHGDQAADAATLLGSRLPAGVRVEVFDMPVELWQSAKREKKHADAAGLISILQRYCAAGLGQEAGSNGRTVSPAAPKPPPSKAASTKGSGKRTRRRKGEEKEVVVGVAAAAAGAGSPEGLGQAEEGQGSSEQPDAQQQQQQEEQHGLQQGQGAWPHAEPAVVRAIVEYSTPQFMSGKYAWYGLGFSVGLLNGLLAAAGITYQRVSAPTWKSGMGLNKAGKEGSLALACHLWPDAADLLKRKRDHGRAEALLLAAWGLGVRMRPISGAADAADSGADSASEGGD